MAWWCLWLVDARWQLFGLTQPSMPAGWMHAIVMQYQVLMQGRKLWSLEPAAGLFEAFVLSEYTQLGEARAGLLADIAKNGRVYGR